MIIHHTLINIWKSKTTRTLLVGFFIMVLSLVGMGIISSMRSFRIARREIEKSFRTTVVLLAEQINDQLFSYEEVAKTLLSSRKIHAINQAPEIVHVIFDLDELQDQLAFLYISNPLQAQITCFLHNIGKKVSSLTGLDPIVVGDSQSNQVIEISTINDQAVGQDPAMAADCWRFIKDDDMGPCLFYRGTDQTNNMTVVIRIPAERLAFIFNKPEFDNSLPVLIFDEKNKGVLFPEGEDLDSDVLGIFAYNTVIDVGPIFHRFPHANLGVVFSSPAAGKIRLGFFHKQDVMYQAVISVRRWLYGFGVLSVVICIAFAVISYRNIVMPFQVLNTAMHHVGEGSFDTRIRTGSTGDIGYIFNQFNMMNSKIESLVREVYLDKIRWQEAQLKLFQSQINPHFLYNCLNLIYQSVRAEEKPVAMDLTLFLSRYYRYATKTHLDMVSVKNEVNHVGDYIRIQSLRYPSKIEYKEDVAGDVLNCSIPRLVLQPIVENAFIHAFPKQKPPWEITVEGFRQGPHVVFKITDNGKGFSEDKIKEITEQFSTRNVTETALGLVNTHLRLAFKYGQESGIKIIPRESRGTTIELRLGNV